MRNFFRKVAFGIGPNEDIPSDPLTWATSQITDKIPDLSWKGKIYTEKELRKKHYKEFIYTQRKVYRKKYKNDKHALNEAIDKLRHETGQRFWENLEICIRHQEAITGISPVLTKLWYFWGNHFTISEKDYLANYVTGAYHRETIRLNLNQSFEKMVYDATISWAMIRHLDNSKNVGPKSISGRADWRREKNEPATINENHARELLELHTVSPKAGQTQEDIIQLAYIMTGWRNKWSERSLETGNVYFDSERHQPGKKIVFGKEYKRGKKTLRIVIKDLVNHPSCRDFIATKLCRYLITDEPTKEMKQPIIKAWEKSDGFLPEVHKAAIKVAFEFNDKYKKFQNPENWFLQMSKIADLKWPHGPEIMDKYVLGDNPNKILREPRFIVNELGIHPYRVQQPNGWSDRSADWMSPELLIRRLVFGTDGYYRTKRENRNTEFYEKIVTKNFDNPDKIMSFINKKDQLDEKHTLLFNHTEFLKA